MNPQDFAIIRHALLFVNDPHTPRMAALTVMAQEALERIEAHQCGLPPSITEALNSGNGSYHP